jgi:hypothetical protein
VAHAAHDDERAVAGGIGAEVIEVEVRVVRGVEVEQRRQEA